MKNPELVASLKARGLSVSKLARLVGIDHRQVSMTLNNVPGRGYRTRPKLARLLTAFELELVGWTSEGRKIADEPIADSQGVPCGTSLHMEQMAEGTVAA